MEIIWYDTKNTCWIDRLDVLYPKYQQYENTHQWEILNKISTEHAQKVHKASLPLAATLSFETILTCICNASFSNKKMINTALMVKPSRILQEYDGFKRLIFQEFFFVSQHKLQWYILWTMENKIQKFKQKKSFWNYLAVCYLPFQWNTMKMPQAF